MYTIDHLTYMPAYLSSLLKELVSVGKMPFTMLSSFPVASFKNQCDCCQETLSVNMTGCFTAHLVCKSKDEVMLSCHACNDKIAYPDQYQIASALENRRGILTGNIEPEKKDVLTNKTSGLPAKGSDAQLNLF